MTEDRETLAARLIAEREAAQEALKPLSPREREVVTLACQGHPGKHIAAMLDLSEKTVCSHREHARRKLGISPAGMVVLAARAGWV